VDITPFDDREYNMFSILNTDKYYSGVIFDGKRYMILKPGKNII